MTKLTYPHFEFHFPRDQWTLPHVLEYHATRSADRPCLSWLDSGKPYTFSEVNSIANQLARGFKDLDVVKGDYVVIFLPNCLEYIFAWYALSKLGAIEVTVGDTYKGDFLKHQVKLSKSKILITTTELAHRLVEIEHELEHIEQIILVNETDKKSSAVDFENINLIQFNSLFNKDKSNLEIEISPRDIAAVLFTSGTTGLSKGVMMSHSQFYFFAEEDVQLVDLGPDDIYSTGFPLFHGNAQFLTVYPSLIAGAHCILYPKFSASDFIGRISRSGSTVCNLLGATMAFILAQPPSETDKNHNLRRIYAAPLAPDLAKKFTARFGVAEFVDGFGQTEISNIFMTPKNEKRPPGASGVLVDQFFEVRLVDPETDEQVPDGEIGELIVRQKLPYIMSSGYLNMPEKTIEAWKNLWFHTGDMLRRDKNGWYYFVDRVKDALRRRGENISSFEVESVVRAHPAIAECAVVAAPADEPGGEDEVKAFIIPQKNESVVMEDLIHWCNERMPAFMVPRYVEEIKALPQTPSEKVRKKALRDMGNSEKTWDKLVAKLDSDKE